MPEIGTTTTLIVENPEYDVLESKYQLFRYELPDKYRFMKDPSKFSKLHIEMKRQLRVPYHIFHYDKVQGERNIKAAVYALYKVGEKPVVLDIEFLQNAKVSAEPIRFEKLELHNIMKLMQMDYALSTDDAFTAIGKYYVHAKGKEKTVTCLWIEIQGDRENNQHPETQEFKIISHAIRLYKQDKNRIKEWFKYRFPYFRREIKQEQALYTQLLPEEIENFEGDMFSVFQLSNERARLDYHSYADPERTRGKKLYDFTNSFVAYLKSLGLNVRQKVREFEKFPVAREDYGLPVENSDLVYIFDDRFNKNCIRTEQYLAWIQNEFPNVNFEPTRKIHADLRYPVLILRDYREGDFKNGQVYSGRKDPYRELYADPDMLHIPKQTLNVNPILAGEGTTIEEYEDYSFDPEAQDLKRKLIVCLNELHLKSLVIQERNVCDQIPTVLRSSDGETNLSNYVFVRQGSYGDKTRFGVALWIEDGKLRFADIQNPSERAHLYRLLEKQNRDWEKDVIAPFKTKYFKEREQDQDLNFDFVIGPGFVAEIENINERIMYDYDEILKRRSEPEERLPLGIFKLAESYDALKPANWPSLKALEGKSQKHTKNWEEARETLGQLRKFDDWIDELDQQYLSLSLDELLSDAKIDRLVDIFKLAPEKVGPKLKRYYRKRGMFLNERSSTDVLALYSGIWYDPSNCYMVGNPNSLQNRQSSAHIIRQFDIYFGEENFDMCPLLDMMAIRFVRHQQYTVYPYPFHLIDLYINNRLRYLD